MASPRPTSFFSRVSDLVEIDSRSLVAFRIGLGIVLLVDLIIRVTSLAAHYTDAGVMPSALVAESYEGTWRWSLHFFSGTVAFQGFLFAVSGVAAFCLAIGFHARISTMICWALWASVQTRTPLLQNGADDILRMLLFWAIFLPLPSRSFPRRQITSARGGTSTIASAAILLQVSLMYFFAGSWKLTGDWINGNELHQILCDGNFARPLAYTLQAFPALTSIAGTAVVLAEHVLPFLLWISPRYWRARCSVVAALALMHLGVEFTLTVGLFSFVCWTALLLFLPTGFWDYLERLTKHSISKSPATEPASIKNGARESSSRYGWVKRTVTGSFVLLSLLYVIAWNLAERGGIKHDRIPMVANRVGEVFSLQQSWRLFDYASNRDGWFIVLARLPNFQYADLLRGGVKADDETFSRPAYPYRRFPDHRWRKLYSHLVDDHSQAYREALCRYLARQWACDHGEHNAAQAIELQYMQELNVPSAPDAYMQRFLCIFELDMESQQ